MVRVVSFKLRAICVGERAPGTIEYEAWRGPQSVESGEEKNLSLLLENET